MNRLFLLLLLTVLPLAATAPAEPADEFLNAYFLIQEADAAHLGGDWAVAHQKFDQARRGLQAIRAATPDWNPHIIDFRLRYCADRLTALGSKLPALPAPAAAPAAPTPPAPPAAASQAETDQKLGELTTRLSQAHERIRELETGRDQLQTRLREALQQVTPAETNVRIEELLEQNQALSAQLATTQQTIQTLSTEAAELQQAREKIKELETARAELTAELRASEERASRIETESNARLADLLKRNQALGAQLDTARAQAATAAGAGSPEQAAAIARLKEQLAEAVLEMERSQQELVASASTVGRLRNDLANVQAENTRLRESYAQLETRYQQAEGRITTLEVASQKDEEIILYLRKENALLKEIADGSARVAAPAPPPRRRGFFGRAQPAPAPATPPAPVVIEEAPPRLAESATERVVAELTAAPAAPAATPGARAAVPAVFETGSANVQTLLQQARAAAEAGHYERAAGLYRDALAAEPNNLLALSNLGVIDYRTGDLEGAETTMRRAVALAPNDGEARALLGIVYFRRGKIEEAFGELTRAIALNPRNAEAHNFLGITLSEKGWGAAAEQQIRKSIELNPQYADAHFNLAALYAGQRPPRLELARYHYEKSRDLGAQPDAALEQILKSAGN